MMDTIQFISWWFVLIKPVQAKLIQKCDSDGYNPVYSLMICVNKTSSGQINSEV